MLSRQKKTNNLELLQESGGSAPQLEDISSGQLLCGGLFSNDKLSNWFTGWGFLWKRFLVPPTLLEVHKCSCWPHGIAASRATSSFSQKNIPDKVIFDDQLDQCQRVNQKKPECLGYHFCHPSNISPTDFLNERAQVSRTLLIGRFSNQRWWQLRSSPRTCPHMARPCDRRAKA